MSDSDSDSDLTVSAGPSSACLLCTAEGGRPFLFTSEDAYNEHLVRNHPDMFPDGIPEALERFRIPEPRKPIVGMPTAGAPGDEKKKADRSEPSEPSEPAETKNESGIQGTNPGMDVDSGDTLKLDAARPAPQTGSAAPPAEGFLHRVKRMFN